MGIFGVTKKSRRQSDAHARDKGFTVVPIGIKCDVDEERNTVTVQANFGPGEFDVQTFGIPGLMIICNECGQETYFGYVYETWRLGSDFGGSLRLNWDSELPVTERSWFNLSYVSLTISSGFHRWSMLVECLSGLPMARLGQYGTLDANLMIRFWCMYFYARTSEGFVPDFFEWAGKMMNAYRQTMVCIDKTTQVKLDRFASAATSAANTILAFKDVDFSDGKSARSAKLQDARESLEEALLRAGYNVSLRKK